MIWYPFKIPWTITMQPNPFPFTTHFANFWGNSLNLFYPTKHAVWYFHIREFSLQSIVFITDTFHDNSLVFFSPLLSTSYSLSSSHAKNSIEWHSNCFYTSNANNIDCRVKLLISTRAHHFWIWFPPKKKTKSSFVFAVVFISKCTNQAWNAMFGYRPCILIVNVVLSV